ncbi:MAG TPA: hypothetical protein VHK90_08870 [Thermoanaerobaculia bacterium]|nr:hypothetical protein [Thermoanaerobaculia bacterium]
MNGRRTMLVLMTAAVAVRLLAATIAIAATDMQPNDLARLRDGPAYLAYVTAIRGGAEGFAQLAEYDRRVFAGYPLLLALIGADRLPLLAIALNWLAAAGAAALAWRLYDDVRVGWAMAVLTPSYLLYSTTVMSEAVVVLAGVAAVLLMTRARGVPAGVALGFAAVARPLALSFGAACLAVRSWRSRTFLSAAIVALLCVAAAGAWLWWWSGSLASGIDVYRSDTRAYGGNAIFTWPFASLIGVPLRESVPLWKIAYIWAHVAVVLAGLVLLLRERPRDRTSLAWLATNTAIAVSIGGIWGFHEFHRFLIPALPPLFYAWRNLLPRHRGIWIAIGIASAVLAARGVGHGW